MYLHHFGLNELPFSIAPDPRYLYMSERHREALAHLVYGLKSSGAFILLTGEVGTGKTTVSRCLLEQLPAGTRLAVVYNPMMNALELLQSICDELHIPRPAETTSIKAHVDAISRDLLAAHARGENTVVLIDEAQNLAPAVLEQLRMLTNLETAERKLLQIILLGQPELRAQLAQPSMSQLSQRITARYHLSPLNFAETRAYVQHRLLVAGSRAPLYSDASLRRVHRLSQGVPRLINVICDRALLGAYVQNKTRVNAATVERAADEVFGRAGAKRKGMMLAALVPALVLAIGAGWYLASQPVERSVVVASETPVVESPPAAVPMQDAAPAPAATAPGWADADLALRSQILAYQSLFRLWKLDYVPDQHGSPCFYAETHGLSCLHETADLERLRGYNRPVVMKLYDEHGDMQFATLLALLPEGLQVDLAGQQQTLSLATLQQHWRGEYTLLWQQPPGYSGLMKPGYSGRDVLWLRQQFRQLAPAQVMPDSSEYDAALAERVRLFQAQQGLMTDGVAGVQTLLRLNEINGAVEPRLIPDESGGAG